MRVRSDGALLLSRLDLPSHLARPHLTTMACGECLARGAVAWLVCSMPFFGGLSSPASETELTRVPASVFAVEPTMAAKFVELVCTRASRPDQNAPA
jgi:hypothetical protein